MFTAPSGLCRIYYFKAGQSVTVGYGSANPVRTLGGNGGWTEVGTRDYEVKLSNLTAARNAAGELSYCVFTSECLTEDRDINDVIKSLLGASYPAGLYDGF